MEGILSGKGRISGVIGKNRTSLSGIIKGSSETELYNGDYEVTPKTYEETILQTKSKFMTDNVTVKKIPQYEISNSQGGETLIIGDEYYGS